MRLQARLAERKKYSAISRHLAHDRTPGKMEQLVLLYLQQTIKIMDNRVLQD